MAGRTDARHDKMTSLAAKLSELRSFSARIGADTRRTQAAGGNTSVKYEGTLWIKASGTWLSQALEKEIFVPVKLNPLLDALATNDPRAETSVEFIDQSQNSLGLRPSIETSVHAAIHWPVVAHVHCVDTLSFAIQSTGEAQITSSLATDSDLHWVNIPYRRPGLPLYKAIAERTKPDTNVYILQNHGLVVAGRTVQEVDDRLHRVCLALNVLPRPMPRANLEKLEQLVKGTAYRLPEHQDAHALALDPISRAFALGGSLYPDHVIFLGPSAIAADVLEKSAENHPMLILPEGVVLLRTTTAAADAMAKCLADVLARVPAGSQLTRLTAEQDYELTHWEAEKYRQTLNVVTLP